MAGTITLDHLALIREVYGDYVAKRCQDAPPSKTFLSVLIQSQVEESALLAGIRRS